MTIAEIQEIQPGPYIIYFNPKKKTGYGVYRRDRKGSRIILQGLLEEETIIVEEHMDLAKVSERELELQRRDGYQLDTQPYWAMLLRNIKSMTLEARKKSRDGTRANPAQNSEEWREARRRYLTGRSNPNHSVKMSGKGNPQYGSGFMYIEVTTGYTGRASDMETKFGINALNLSVYADRNRPMKSGKCKGLYFKKINLE
tara:strand:- start:2308 stop:2907 length:600 start_codon:yes stop_codon:yes gene_type:complete